jgi:hypothetical protein
MAIRILAWLVDVEDMVGMLDGGDGVTEPGNLGDQLN